MYVNYNRKNTICISFFIAMRSVNISLGSFMLAFQLQQYNSSQHVEKIKSEHIHPKKKKRNRLVTFK